MSLRALTATTVVVLAVAGCGYSDAENAYLAEYRQQSAFKTIDEDGALNNGRTACAVLADVKSLDDRKVAAYVLMQRGIPYRDIRLATTYLCPGVQISAY